MYRPEHNFLGGFTPNDGTIEFYGRIKALAQPDHTILDLGAGRAAWFEDDICKYRKQIQTFKGHVREVIAADIDEVVMQNRSADHNVIIGESVPLPDNSVDIIIADYVLEHIQDPEHFASEVRRLLRPSGVFCARTPHKCSYIAIGARVVPNQKHTVYLRSLQPDRKSQDVFPTAYKLNTMRSIQHHFGDYENFSYIFRTDPSYFFGRRWAYKALNAVHRFAPDWFSGNIFAFLQKK